MSHFQNPSKGDIKALLERVHTIAVVGLSPRLNRPSHMVASNLQRFGYRIIPIRPAVAAVLGEKAYANLHEVCRAASGILPPATLAHPCAAKIDMVDVFRAPEHVDAIVDECIALGIKAIWLQDGVVNEPAAVKARATGRHYGRYGSLCVSGLCAFFWSRAAVRAFHSRLAGGQKR